MKHDTRKRLWRWIKQNRLPLTIFFIYLIITLVAVLFHENWEDEAQAWLSARDCTPIELFERMGIEGHFLPWYLILMPFAKLGFPYVTTNIISWLITSISAWLMLRHLPCKFYKRVIFIFMLPMLYLYPAISRCYCLLPLGTILAIMFYRDRFEKPLRYLLSILIIASVHICTLMFAFVMGLEYVVDWFKKRKVISKKQNTIITCGIVVTVLLVALSCLPLLESVGMDKDAASGVNIKHIENPLRALFIVTPIKIFKYFYVEHLFGFIYIAALFLVAWEFFTRKTEFIKIAIPIIWQVFITCFIFDIMLLHRVATILFIILFFVACRSWREKKQSPPSAMWGTTNITLDFLFVAITLWVEINTGNKNLAFLAFFSLVLALSLLYVKFKKPKLKAKYYSVGHSLAKAALVFLALTQVLSGFKSVKEEIETPYTDALATAGFINQNISDDSILLTSQDSSMFLTAIIPYLNETHSRFYHIGLGTFYTYTIDPAPKPKYFVNLDNINWQSYCHFQKDLYYIGLTEQAYGDSNIFDIASEPVFPTTNLQNDGVLTKIFDIKVGAAAMEHYTIYQVNPQICE